LTQDYGWRSALGLVVAMLLVAGLIALLTLRDCPADLGLAPYGAKTSAARRDDGFAHRRAL
jgi:hypothetical protein